MPVSAVSELENSDHRIAFIGGGNMSRSLIGGLISHGASAQNIVVSEPDTELREALVSDFRIGAHADNDAAAQKADVLVLAVKPQIMKSVCVGMRAFVQAKRPLIISIAAGIRIDQIEEWLGCEVSAVRCMPNTPALIGAGATALCANKRTQTGEREIAQNILAAAGIVVWIDDESLMDIVTALSGSGPAYFFLLVEALENAAVAQGLPRDAARALATQTCLGAGRMLREDGAVPAELRQRVTSPSGTTQAALESFAADDFEKIVARAIAVATLRGRELSQQSDD
jgi:pyrroline-5-carboxylate reductase